MRPHAAPHQRSQRHVLGLILVLGCGLIACHVLWLPRIVVDDAFISYRYARNLASGHGLTFNPNVRVEGYSNFLWVLLTAAGIRGGFDPIAWTRALGAVSLMGSLLLAVILTCRVTRSNAAAGAVTLILSASTALCGSAMAGLETGLYTGLVTGTAVCIAYRQPRVASLLIGLAAWTRPEGLGLAAIGLMLLLLTQRRGGRRRAALEFCLPFGVLLTTLFVFRLSYFGHWLPNSVQAKSALLPLLGTAPFVDWPGLVFNDPGLSYLGAFIRYAFGACVLFAILPVLLGHKRDRFVAWFMATAVAMGGAVAVYNFGDWMSGFRLLTPYLPIATVLTVWGVAETIAFVARRAGARGRALAGFGATLLVVHVAAGQFQRQRSRVGRSADAQLAGMLNASRQPDLLAATDVLGRLSYYADRVRILDMAGLTDAHIARYGTPSPPFGRTDFAYVLRRKPQFIMNNVRAAWRKHLHTPAFTEHYWWVDHPRWTRPIAGAGRPRFVFVRRGSILASEFRLMYRDAAFRNPAEIQEASAPSVRNPEWPRLQEETPALFPPDSVRAL